jgi:hypothetical protein
MAQPHHPHTSSAGSPGETPQPPPLRVRVAGWDVICTAAILTALVAVAATTSWPSRLFGFIAHVCADDSCAPVPFGIDLWIYPVVWGGIGAGIAAAVIGPVVSVLKGWHLFFWPILAIAIVILSSVAGSMMTVFSEHYWR